MSGYCNESEKCSDNTNQQFPCPKSNIALETGNWEYCDDPFFLGWPVFGGKLLVLGMVSLKIQNSRHTYFQQKWCHHSLHFDCVVTLFVSLHFEANVVTTFTDEWMYTKISRLVLMNERVHHFQVPCESSGVFSQNKTTFANLSFQFANRKNHHQTLESKGTPPKPTPPRNKALVRPY